jgi:hypothetical protein
LSEFLHNTPKIRDTYKKEYLAAVKLEIFVDGGDGSLQPMLIVQVVILLHISLAVMHTFPAHIGFAAFANVEQYWQSLINHKVNTGMS